MGRRQHQTILWIALAMGLPLRPVIAQQAPAQMAGAVVDASTGVSVAGADILHLGDRRKVMSDSLGKYLFDSLPPGIVRFVVRSPGFPPTMVTVALAAGEKMARDIELDSTSVGRRAAQNLPRVAIEALSAPTPRFRDFERRRLTGRGQYLGREDIERSNFASLLDAMRGLRGVNITCGNGTACAIRMARAPMRCPPDYIVDERNDNFFGPNTPIRDIEAIEVYTGPSDVPGEFSGRTAGCGVIVIWTRSGPSRRK